MIFKSSLVIEEDTLHRKSSKFHDDNQVLTSKEFSTDMQVIEINTKNHLHPFTLYLIR